MSALSAQLVVDAGTPPTFAAASVADTAPIGNGHNTYAHYKNGSGSTVTLTVSAQGLEAYGVAKPNNVITIAAGAEARVPLRKDYDDGTGTAHLGLSSATTVTVAIVQVS